MKELKVSTAQLFGDSTVIVGWASFTNVLNVASLEHWKKKVRLLLNHSEQYSLKHVSHMYNLRADRLSKRGLQLEEGFLEITHFHAPRPPEILLVHLY